MNYECEDCDYSNTPRGRLFLRLTYYYFLLKVMDLFDTVSAVVVVVYVNVLSYRFFPAALHHPEEEGLASVVPPLLPSLLHGTGLLHCCPLGAGRSLNHARHHQQHRTYNHVLLLLPHRIPTRVEAVHLVEEAHHSSSAHPVCLPAHSLPARRFLHRVQLPEVLAVGDGDPECLYAVALWRLLQKDLLADESKGPMSSAHNLNLFLC
jgi:hypothetical protein